jgi:hypothetical protein
VVIDPYRNLRAVAANGLDRATFHRLFAERFLIRRFRLLVYVGMSTIIVTTEVRGRGLTAKIAVYALVIDIELSLYILGVFICGVGHFFKAGKNVVESRMNRNWRNGFLPRATAPNLECEESIT